MIHTRHSELFDCSRLGVTIVGAGGIGAVTALTLAKMGVASIQIWDKDKIGEENLATQLHQPSDTGGNKALSVKKTIELFTDDVEVDAVPWMVEHDTALYGSVIISAVDSIAARKVIWSALDKYGKWVWYIDTRMGAEKAEILCVNTQDRAWYAGLLAETDDSQFEEAPCTKKSTYFCASGIACLLGELVRMVASDEVLPKFITSDFRPPFRSGSF
jgi:molybdopterin/thiamine biosynthesis adenylyltransferase